MTTAPTRIIVGVDGSDGAAHALRWAADEADLQGAALTAVMSWGFLDQHHTVLRERFDPHYDEQAALAALTGYVSAVVGDERATTIDKRPICELPARALVEAAAGADLLVVGARGLGGFRGLLLGSVSQHCLQHAPVPVAIVRQPAARDGRVVAAVDDSPTALRALQWAVTEAGQRKTPLHVLHAWAAPHRLRRPRHGPPRRRSNRRELDKIVASVDTANVDMQLHTVRGTPASAILHAAEDAELIVMGTRGGGAFKRVLLGSTAHQVTLHATCPVVVVPEAR